MADFHQHGIITTLHHLETLPLEELEAQLMSFRKQRPMALVLPSLYSELEGPALSGIVDELSKVRYLEQVIVGLDRATEEEFVKAIEFFRRMPQQPTILWNDGPRLRKIDRLLQSHGLAPDQPGKGRNVWYMFGYVLATGRAQAVALHDCDITTYDRSMLSRLIYPIANPSFSYKFCKGFYARIANQSMNGRVCRLLVTPLVRALATVCGSNRYLDYLDSFRYALAGEFALQRDVIEDIRIPSDWGLEMGILSELHRNYATSQICQVDVADNYDHKHQDLSADDKERGLSKMSSDIAKSLFRKMATQGEVFSTERIRTLKATYFRIALDLVESYHNDAVFNGLSYDRHKESKAIEVFAENVMQAGHDFLDKAMEIPFMPSWKRVVSAIPDIFDQLTEAVEADAAEFGSTATSVGGTLPSLTRLRHRVRRHMEEIYGPGDADELTERLLSETKLNGYGQGEAALANKWSESDVMMISYGDSIISSDNPPLQSLHGFLKKRLDGVISGVHLLPFFPFSSDDGFSVIDYLKVNPELGDWSDIRKIGEDFKLMGDLVINHCSSQHAWFQNYLKGESPGVGYFVESEPDADYASVVRPRATPLFTEVKTHDGQREVWCTFGPDQVDLNFANPDVLFEFIRILKFYLDNGITHFRMDAIGFLWKVPGTSSIHLPQTHEIVKLLRLVIENLEPNAVVITETNVPNRENLSYFGNENEAHMIYNFSLPPLLVHALLTGDCQHLKTWMMSMPPARQGRTYLNFIASHDGIGVRPAEGLLSPPQLEAMLDTLRGFGGHISMRTMPNGESKPYEVNISLYEALKGTIEGGPDAMNVERFVCAHTIALALEGLPAFYIHSLLGTLNDDARVEETGRARSINRHQWDLDKVDAALNNAESHHARVFSELSRRIQIRREQGAFHPNATQYTLHFGRAVFAFWRESLDRRQSIFALHNVSAVPQKIPLVELNLIATDSWRDLLSDKTLTDLDSELVLEPYQAVWITNT